MKFRAKNAITATELSRTKTDMVLKSPHIGDLHEV